MRLGRRNGGPAVLARQEPVRLLRLADVGLDASAPDACLDAPSLMRLFPMRTSPSSKSTSCSSTHRTRDAPARRRMAARCSPRGPKTRETVSATRSPRRMASPPCRRARRLMRFAAASSAGAETALLDEMGFLQGKMGSRPHLMASGGHRKAFGSQRMACGSQPPGAARPSTVVARPSAGVARRSAGFARPSAGIARPPFPLAPTS